MLRDILSQNLLHSWRHLRRKPSFCIVVIATLALGIGVNTAIFSLTYGLLLRPFPYTSPDQLVRLRTDSTRPGQPAVDISVPDLYDYRAANRTFVDMGIFAPRNIDLVDGTASQSVNVALTTPGAFNALAVEPLVGRTFLDDEDRLGGDIYKTVLSYELWQARYGRDPNILGKQIRTPIASYTVIGIMPPGKAYPSHTEMWIPLQSYLRLAGIGCVLGCASSLVGGRLVSQQLYGINANDPPTYILTAGLLTVIGLAASYAPARRALRVDPLQVLQQ